ncbi:hypothetical protein H5410_032097 [Solanum commersonii]|uniref:Uncharacterized protein n=1 Tax=Solanum commersonii TaxID=4109 RepID=A0A9J5YLW2_SOLCO|nr:hypothetical protein H5410_032097 [Solanum commersonii]
MRGNSFSSRHIKVEQQRVRRVATSARRAEYRGRSTGKASCSEQDQSEYEKSDEQPTASNSSEPLKRI